VQQLVECNFGVSCCCVA